LWEIGRKVWLQHTKIEEQIPPCSALFLLGPALISSGLSRAAILLALLFLGMMMIPILIMNAEKGRQF
jgi:hypothetical protein